MKAKSNLVSYTIVHSCSLAVSGHLYKLKAHVLILGQGWFVCLVGFVILEISCEVMLS